MNKRKIIKRIFLSFVCVLILCFCFIGMYAHSLMNDPDYITIGVNQTYTLSPDSDDCMLRSYNASVLTPVGASSVVGNSEGDAVMCIKYSYFSRDFYRFKVVEEPSSVTLSETALTLGKGESFSLSAECTSSDHSFDVSYSSSDESVASVSSDGVITALAVGTCEITATAYNGVSDVCSLTVCKAPGKFALSETSVVLGEGENLTLSPVFKDKEHSSSLSYVSDDNSIATVEDGVISARSTGKCKVTCTTHNGKKAHCTITVKKMPDSIDLIALDKYSPKSRFDLIIGMDSDYAAHSYKVDVSDSSVIEQTDDSALSFVCKEKGKATITVTLSNGVSAQKSITVTDTKKGKVSFRILNQFPALPTGCEVVSLTSVLNHYGMDVSMTTMADKYMPKSSSYYSVSPHDYFLGTPYTWDGFGCFSGCIVKTANNYFADNNIDDYYALDITGCSTNELFDYLANSVPVITWVTSGFVTPTNDGSWYVGDEHITWCNHEHCLVTTGFDKESGTVTVADDCGGYSYTVSMSQYKKVFEGMGSMAVVILQK